MPDYDTMIATLITMIRMFARYGLADHADRVRRDLLRVRYAQFMAGGGK